MYSVRFLVLNFCLTIWQYIFRLTGEVCCGDASLYHRDGRREVIDGRGRVGEWKIGDNCLPQPCDSVDKLSCTMHSTAPRSLACRQQAPWKQKKVIISCLLPKMSRLATCHIWLTADRCSQLDNPLFHAVKDTTLLSQFLYCKLFVYI